MTLQIERNLQATVAANNLRFEIYNLKLGQRHWRSAAAT
jgi:hypothetical protein